MWPYLDMFKKKESNVTNMTSFPDCLAQVFDDNNEDYDEDDKQLFVR